MPSHFATPGDEVLVLGATRGELGGSAYWAEVRDFGATVFDFMGATLTMLYKRSPLPSDLDNPARLGWGVPVPEFADDFARLTGAK